MYRFALRPRWIFGHLVVLSVVVLFVSLGLWQLRRLDERRDHNALLADRSEKVVPLPAEGWSEPTDSGNLALRRVRVQGRYQSDREVLVRFRSKQGLPGYHVLTPIVTGRGAVIVNRGWVPLAMGDGWPAAEARPPAGDISVVGLLRPSEPADRFLPDDQGPDAPPSVGAVNLPGLERLLSMPLYGLYVELQGDRTAAGFPAPLPAPDRGNGPHLTYAVQWFLFAAGFAGGWAILVRTSARGRAADGRVGAADLEHQGEVATEVAADGGHHAAGDAEGHRPRVTAAEPGKER